MPHICVASLLTPQSPGDDTSSRTISSISPRVTTTAWAAADIRLPATIKTSFIENRMSLRNSSAVS
jgi:hypothetical protein